MSYHIIFRWTGLCLIVALITIVSTAYASTETVTLSAGIPATCQQDLARRPPDPTAPPFDRIVAVCIGGRGYNIPLKYLPKRYWLDQIGKAHVLGDIFSMTLKWPGLLGSAINEDVLDHYGYMNNRVNVDIISSYVKDSMSFHEERLQTGLPIHVGTAFGAEAYFDRYNGINSFLISGYVNKRLVVGWCPLGELERNRVPSASEMEGRLRSLELNCRLRFLDANGNYTEVELPAMLMSKWELIASRIMSIIQSF